VLVILYTAPGCGDVVRTGRAPVLLVMDSLEGAPGGVPLRFSSVLQSDVLTVVTRPGSADGTEATVFPDWGQAAIRLLPKDPGPVGTPATPSDLNAVTLSRYRVTYRRSDGRDVPGVDVPYAFDSAVTATVRAGDGVVVGLELVRLQAKLEPPLRNLRSGGGAIAISTIADVTLYGRDVLGHDVSVSGSLSVVFADWADSD